MANAIDILQPAQRSVVPEVLITNAKPTSISEVQFNASEFALSIDIENGTEIRLATARVNFATSVGKGGFFISNDKFIQYLKQRITPFSIISIKIDRNSWDPDFVGVVNLVYESITTNNNDVSRSLAVNCSLYIPYLLMKDSLPLAAILEGNQTVSAKLGAARAQFFQYQRGANEAQYPFANQPANAIMWILKNAPSTNILNQKLRSFVDNWSTLKEMNKDQSLGNPMINLQMLNFEYLFDPNLSIYSGTVYDYMLKCVDLPWYEVFWDSKLGSDSQYYNQLTIRPKPFSYKSRDNSKVQGDGWLYWDDLDYINFESKYRLSENLGYTDVEVSNFFSVMYNLSLIAAPGSAMGMLGAMFPVLYFPSIKQFGLRQMQVASTMLNLSSFTKKFKDAMKNYTSIQASEITPDELSYLFEKRDKIVHWTLPLPLLQSGQMTVMGNEAYRIGKRLFYQDKEYLDDQGNVHQGVYYYISGKGDHYRYPGEWQTNLSLTRGQAQGYVESTLNRIYGSSDLYQTDDWPKPFATGISSLDTQSKWNTRVKGIGGIK